MSEIDHFETVCRPLFQTINAKLDRVDKAIRGNGITGIQTRLDRLEQARITLGRLAWIVIGAATASIVSALVTIMRS